MRLIKQCILFVLTIALLAGCKDDTSSSNNEPDMFNVSVTADPSNAGSVSPSGENQYESGTTIQLQATSNQGYVFDRWAGDVSSSANPYEFTVDEDYTVVGIFAEIPEGKAIVDINVDWESLGDTGNNRMKANISDSVTHFGARLMYPLQNASFQQSVEKSTAEEQGVITMEVPEADSARLLVAAVRHETGNDKAYLFGVLEDLEIQTGTGYQWNIDDFQWTEAFWEPADSLAEDYNSGGFTVSKDRETFDFYFLVTDPFYPKSDPPLDSYLIRLNGYGGNQKYENGYRVMRQIAENPDVGTANQSEHDNFFPYLKSEMFQLPDARYVVYKKGRFTVNWE